MTDGAFAACDERARPDPQAADFPAEPEPIAIADARNAGDTQIRLEKFASFEAAEATWRGIESQSFCHIFQSFDWLAAWHRTIGTAEKVTPCIVHATDRGGNTIMLLPLATQRRHGLSFLSFMGGIVTDYHAPLLGTAHAGRLDAACVKDLLACIMRSLPGVDVIAFERMPASLGPQRNPFAELPGVTHVWSAHLARLPTSFEAFKKTRKSKLFTDTARRWRLLSQLGEARIELAQTTEAAAEIFAAFARQKSRRWDDSGARNLFASPGYLAFYRALAEGLAAGPGHLSALRVDDTIVATHLGAVFRGRFYYLMPGHEAGDWGRFSVGRQLMKGLIERSIAAGLTEFDFTIGDEAFKAEWADVSVPLYDYTRGVTVRGRIYRQAVGYRERFRARAKRVSWLRLLVRRLRNSPRGPGQGLPDQ